MERTRQGLAVKTHSPWPPPERDREDVPKTKKVTEGDMCQHQ